MTALCSGSSHCKCLNLPESGGSAFPDNCRSGPNRQSIQDPHRRLRAVGV